MVKRTIGLALTEIRKKLDWTKVKLAEMSDLSEVQIGRIENHKTIPSLASTCRIAAVLGYRISDLLNVAEYINWERAFGAFITVPYGTGTPELWSVVAKFNQVDMPGVFDLPALASDCFHLLFDFREIIASYELASPFYLGTASYGAGANKTISRCFAETIPPINPPQGTTKFQSIGEAVRILRIITDRTCGDVERATGISTAQLSKIENEFGVAVVKVQKTALKIFRAS